MSKLSAEQREEFTTTEQRLTFVRRSHTKKYRDKRGYYSTTIWNVYLCICGNEKIAQQNVSISKNIFDDSKTYNEIRSSDNPASADCQR